MFSVITDRKVLQIHPANTSVEAGEELAQHRLPPISRARVLEIGLQSYFQNSSPNKCYLVLLSVAAVSPPCRRRVFSLGIHSTSALHNVFSAVSLGGKSLPWYPPASFFLFSLSASWDILGHRLVGRDVLMEPGIYCARSCCSVGLFYSKLLLYQQVYSIAKLII